MTGDERPQVARLQAEVAALSRELEVARECHVEKLERARKAEADLAAARLETAALRRFLVAEVLPRYAEMFVAAGLGDPSESVVVQDAKQLLGGPAHAASSTDKEANDDRD